MKLIDVLSQLDALPEETFICVRRPWSHEAETLLVPYPEDWRVPAEVLAQGFEYFLEVSTTREVLEGFLERNPTMEQVTDFVTYYAEFDAFPEWADSP